MWYPHASQKQELGENAPLGKQQIQVPLHEQFYQRRVHVTGNQVQILKSSMYMHREYMNVYTRSVNCVQLLTQGCKAARADFDPSEESPRHQVQR